MPMHDWTRVPPTIYHHFHQRWTISICDFLNGGLLPAGYSALVEQYSSGLYPDVLTVERRSQKPPNPRFDAATLEEPRTRMTVHPREGRFHERGNRVVIHHHLGDIVSVIEVVSPGSKAGRLAVRDFVGKAVSFLKRCVNLLIVDPFPAGLHDPRTLHALIWDEFDEDAPFELPADEPLLLVSYRSSAPLSEWSPVANIEPLRVGAQLPNMPVWLDSDLHVSLPLERTYQTAWDVCPPDFRQFVELRKLPDEPAS